MTELSTPDDFYRLLRNVIVPDRATRIVAEDPSKEGTSELAAFAGYALETLEGESWTTQPQVLFFRRKMGRPLREVSLPAYSLLEEEGALHLFAFHYDPAPDAPFVLEQRVIEREKAKLEALVHILRSSDLDLAQLSGDVDTKQLESVRRFLRSDKCSVVKYFVVTNQRKSERSRAERTSDGKVFNEVVDIDRLYKWSKGTASRSEIEVLVSDYLGPERLTALSAPITSDEVTTYLTVLPGRFLAELYENFDNRLLELNVRSYLSAKSAVNKGIIDTIKSPERRGFFLPYNNGIVMVVDEVTTEHTSKNVVEIKWMKGLQIVNGGQTTASLFKARRELKDQGSLHEVYVQTKIVHLKNSTRSEEIVKSISKYANSQNKVEMADLGANEAFHRRIEKLAESELDPKEACYWTYERMRNSYATQLMLEASPAARKRWQATHPRDRVVTKTDLAKAILAWDRQPWLVARGGQKCFTAFAQSYHVKPIKSDEAAMAEVTRDRFYETIGKVILYRTVHKIVRSDREVFLSNQVNIATYTVAYISHRVRGEIDWKSVWKNQGVSPEFQRLMKAFARRVASFLDAASQGRLASEVSKKEGLFDDLLRALDGIDSSGELDGASLDVPELRGHLDEGSDPITPEEAATIAEVMAYTEERLGKIRAIAEQNRDAISAYHLGVIQNVDTLAKGGWSQNPKPKQAAMFLKAIATLENYGLLSAEDAS